MHFHYLTYEYGHALAQEPLPLGVMTFTILVESLQHCLNQDFLRNTSNIHFLPQNYLPLEVRDHEIYNFLSPYTTDNTYQIWLKLAN